MNKEVQEVADLLWLRARQFGIDRALHDSLEYNIQIINLPMKKEFLETDIVEFDFDTRTNNIISKWCKLHSDEPRNVKQIVKLIEMGNKAKEFVSGYGTKCQNKLKAWMLIECYDRLSVEEQKKFCMDLITTNCRFEEAPHA